MKYTVEEFHNTTNTVTVVCLATTAANFYHKVKWIFFTASFF